MSLTLYTPGAHTTIFVDIENFFYCFEPEAVCATILFTARLPFITMSHSARKASHRDSIAAG
jgi:hypothetical protein